ncbi:MAG TPA: O-antigen ligase family protein [Casimicrobiaceae bacterium]|jgi:O-antigen ligase
MHFRSRSQFAFRLDGASVEFALLIALAITLPMFEGVKNILWGLYAAAWYVNRLRNGWSWKALGGRWDRWDTILAIWLTGTVLGAAFAGMQADEWRGCRDMFRMASILWFIKRSGYSDTQWLRLQIALQIGVTLATVWALAALAWPHTYEGIQLNSVGHVNQSVIYIVICFGALLGAVSAYWRTMRLWLRTLSLSEVAILLGALFAAASRSAAATAMIGALAFGLLWLRHSPRFFIWIVIVTAAFATVVARFDTDMRRKQEYAKASSSPLLNERSPIWQQAVSAWRAYPIFGVGGDNFAHIDAARIQRWESARGENYDVTAFVGTSHAHSLYLNTLAGRGLVGVALLALLLVAWATSLLGALPRARDPPLYWLNWSGAASAWVASVCIGLFNTTLHDEHGLLAFMLLGIWLSYLQQRRAHAAAVPAQAGIATAAAVHATVTERLLR